MKPASPRKYFTPSALKGQKGVHVFAYGSTGYKTQDIRSRQIRNRKGLVRWVIRDKEYTPSELCNHLNKWIADRMVKPDGTRRAGVVIQINMYDDSDWMRRKYGEVKHKSYTIKDGRIQRDF